MANEKRLIDANDFMKALENADADVCEEFFLGCDWGFSKKVITELIQNVPTVDAVEVVRCQNCGHHSSNGCLGDRVWCRKLSRYMDADGFCSCGWRE